MSQLAAKEAIDEAVRRLFSPNLVNKLKQRQFKDKLILRWHTTIKRLLPLGGASIGNKVKIMSDGDVAFGEMWSAINSAKSNIVMETYTIMPDTVGKKTIDLLGQARERGSGVVLIYDAVGSSKMSDQDLKPLRDKGGLVLTFNPWWKRPWKFAPGLFFRNHRKLLVVDDAVGFAGGMNISNLYAGKESGGTGYFRDTHVKVEGPAVNHLTHIFYHTLTDLAYSQPIMPRAWTPPGRFLLPFLMPFHKPYMHEENIIPDTSSGVFVQVLESNVRRNRRHIQKAMRITLRNAHNHCYFTTPYFLPTARLRRAIVKAAGRGVDVRIITAGLSDVPLVQLASQHVYSIFLKRGVRIYEMHESRLHAKIVTIDGIYSSVGSFNLDPWSSNSNLEINLTMLDPDIALQLENQFTKDLKSCREITLDVLENRPFLFKVLHWTAYQVLRLIRPSSRGLASTKDG
eukprot:TRINITY_DN11131_c0_g1_i1.p1 TRINITY_DN11131_c0_g1~~TRINITY_DN11131_c0_g1_i1.p1  ORF type:complete len:457 (+),score=89.13 TRINITY_DN11131_c0_g1_i1:16-1386(+)